MILYLSMILSLKSLVFIWVGTYFVFKFELFKYLAFTEDMLPQWKLTHKRMLNKL